MSADSSAAKRRRGAARVESPFPGVTTPSTKARGTPAPSALAADSAAPAVALLGALRLANSPVPVPASGSSWTPSSIGPSPATPAAHAGAADPRERIVQAACVVFLRDGYHRTTIAAVARAARASKATVYEHFASKETLFFAACQSVMETSWQTLVPALEAQGPAAARPADAVDAMLQFLPMLVDTCPLFLELWALLSRDPGLRSDALAAFRAFYRGLARGLTAVIERAAPGSYLPGEAEARAFALIAAFDGLCYQWLFMDDRVLLTRTGQAIRSMWLESLRSHARRAAGEGTAAATATAAATDGAADATRSGAGPHADDARGAAKRRDLA